MSIGTSLKFLRGKRKLTQGELAEKTGMKLGHISKIERDETDPKLSTIQKLIRALECTPNDLMLSGEQSSARNQFEDFAGAAKHLTIKDIELLMEVLNRFIMADNVKGLMNGTVNMKQVEDEERYYHYAKQRFDDAAEVEYRYEDAIRNDNNGDRT